MKVKFTVFSSLILILMLGACKSLPLPGSPTESLFVLTGQMDRRLGSQNGRQRTASQVAITLENVDTGKTKTIYFTPSKKFIAVPLEPGLYIFPSKVRIDMSENPGGSWTQEQYVGISPFQIEPTTVFISPSVFKLTSDSRGWFNISTNTSLSNTNVIKKEAVKELFEDRRYKAWELYQLVGWDMEE